MEFPKNVQVLTKKKLAEFGGEVRKSAKRVEWAVNEVKTRGVALDYEGSNSELDRIFI